MTDEPAGWATALGIDAATAARFETLAASLDLTPAGVVALLVGRAIEMDDRMRALGVNGVGYWRSDKASVAADVADDALSGLPLDIRESGMMWPAERPFPWSAEACKAAVIGYEVKWTGTFDDFLEHLRGKWELSDGYAVLWQA